MANGDPIKKSDLWGLIHEKNKLQEELLRKYNGGVININNEEMNELKGKFAAILDNIHKRENEIQDFGKKHFPHAA